MKFPFTFKFVRTLIPLLLLLVVIPSAAQNVNLLNNNALNDSWIKVIQSLADGQTEYIKRIYSKEVEAPKELINGKEYESYYTRSPFKPLLFPDKARTATLSTKTRKYKNLTLQYDTFLDEVIYTDTSRTINYSYPQIALNKDIVQGFNLYFRDDSTIFRYFRLPECDEMDLKEGFYEVAYEGKSKYLIKHASSFYVKEGLPNYQYSRKDYITVGKKFVPIKNRKSLLRLFGEKSGIVKGYIHSSRIRIKQADKSQIVSILKFYDSL
jgi:hypothetical protein